MTRRAARWCMGVLLAWSVAVSADAQTVESARTTAVTLTDLLVAPTATRDTSGGIALSQPDRQPGAWRFRAGPYGWPEALSLNGAPPHATRLDWGGVDLRDLLGGDIKAHVLPVAWTPAPVVRGLGIHAALDSFDAPQPLTHLRYLSGDEGLQRVELLHAQARQRTLLGRSGLLRVRGGYFGATANNAFENSDLRRGRALIGWADFTSGDLHMSLRALHTRHAVGAPGGIVPVDSANYQSIYFRQDGIPLSSPRLTTADRQSIRTDLTANVGWRGTDVALTRSYLRRQYDASDTSLVGRARRIDLRAERGPFYATLSRTTPGDANAWVDAPTQHIAEVGARIGWRGLALRGGVWLGDASVSPVGEASFARGPLRVEAELGATETPLLARSGWGAFVLPTDGEAMRWLRASASARAVRGDLGGWARVSGWTAPDGHDWREVQRDTLHFANIGAVSRALVSLGAGWRMDAPLGLYAWAEATATHAIGDADWRDAQPPLHATARIGTRLILFRRDLLLDLYTDLRGWTAHAGRTLHAPTGLYALPYPSARRVPASGTVDLWIRARVRTATLFYGAENVLSRTEVMLGNLAVPDQPLPARRVRFGVFWPIDG